METTSTGAHCALSRFHSRFRPHRTFSPTTAISKSGLPQKCCPLNRSLRRRTQWSVLSSVRAGIYRHCRSCSAYRIANREGPRYPSRDVVRRVADVFAGCISAGTSRFAKKTAVARSVYCIDAARAFLSISASSASAERLFGDAGYQEGTLRQGTGSLVTEMLLMVRRYVVVHLNSPFEAKQDS